MPQGLIAARKARHEDPAGKGKKDAAGVLFRRGGNIGAFEGLEVPTQLREVKKVANQAGVGLKGVKISIVRGEEFIGKTLYGYASVNRIQLYPDAFINYEILVKTLGHERTHIHQFHLFGKPANTELGNLFEEAAYGIEETFWNHYKLNAK